MVANWGLWIKHLDNSALKCLRASTLHIHWATGKASTSFSEEESLETEHLLGGLSGG